MSRNRSTTGDTLGRTWPVLYEASWSSGGEREGANLSWARLRDDLVRDTVGMTSTQAVILALWLERNGKGRPMVADI